MSRSMSAPNPYNQRSSVCVSYIRPVSAERLLDMNSMVLVTIENQWTYTRARRQEVTHPISASSTLSRVVPGFQNPSQTRGVPLE